MTTLFIIGDSTASAYPKELFPRMGWAEILKDLFVNDKIQIENKALSGRRSKSFYDEKAWEEFAGSIKKGDYLLIQFGHNDEKNNDPARFTEPFTSFKNYLKIYIDAARSKKAYPVLLTPIHRNLWDNDKIRDSHKEYLAAIRETAAEENIPLIDMADKTKFYFESLGKEKMKDIFLILEKGVSLNYPEGISDNTHLQQKGARAIAELFIEGIKELKLEISAYLKN